MLLPEDFIFLVQFDQPKHSHKHFIPTDQTVKSAVNRFTQRSLKMNVSARSDYGLCLPKMRHRMRHHSQHDHPNNTVSRPAIVSAVGRWKDNKFKC